MSSKSLGKSVSVVKSVESLLPKGINLKHVLLGLLVGLLICMMFGQTVEGLGVVNSDNDMTHYVCSGSGRSAVILTSSNATSINNLPAGIDTNGNTVICKDSSNNYTGDPTYSPTPADTPATFVSIATDKTKNDYTCGSEDRYGFIRNHNIPFWAYRVQVLQVTAPTKLFV